MILPNVLSDDFDSLPDPELVNNLLGRVEVQHGYFLCLQQDGGILPVSHITCTENW